MALEEEKYEEQDDLGTGNETKKPESSNQENVELSPMALELIKSLQSQINELKGSQLQNMQVNNGGITAEFLEKLISKQNQPTSGQFSFDTMHSMDDLDPDDVLDVSEQVTFVAHKVFHVIVDDQRNGKNIKAPFKPIKFKYESTKRVTNGKEVNLINLCTYTCRSRKELEFLKNHSTFGFMFFDSVKSALSVDHQRANLMVKAVTQLRTIGQHEIVQLCQRRGLPVTNDIDSMRLSIAMAQVDEQLETTKQKFVQSMEDNMKESMIVGLEDQLGKKVS